MRARPQLVLILLFVLGLLAPSIAAATPPIPPGHEQEVLDMVHPFGLGAEPVEGWQLQTMGIDRVWIDLELVDAQTDERVRLRLVHPDDASSEALGHSQSFALELIEGEAAKLGPALDRLLAALAAHDKGEFWRELEPPVDTPDSRPLPAALPASLVPSLVAIALLGLLGLAFELWTRADERPLRDRREPTTPWPMLGLALVALALALWSSRGDLAELVRAPHLHQSDFQVYYHAAQAMAAGVNPYFHGDLAAFSGVEGILGCKYPPLVVAAYAPLASLDFVTASALFMALKLAALAALVVVWVRWLPGGERGALTLAMVALLWNYAFAIDLHSGNVSVLEQLALWLAILALMHDRRLAFALALACGALFKILPISFAALALVIVEPRRSALPTLAVAGGLLAAALAASALAYPELSGQWWAQTKGAALDEIGFHAPSVLAMIHGQRGGGYLDPTYLAALAGVALVSGLALVRGRDAEPIDRVMFGVLALTLMWPRLKDYTFIVVAAPAGCLVALLWQRGRAQLGWRVLAVAIPAAGYWLTDPGSGAPATDFRPLWLLVGLWAAYALALALPQPTHGTGS